MIAKLVTRRFKAYPVACAVGIVGFALYAGTASAGVCDLKDGTRDTGWSISFAGDQVSNCRFVGNSGTGRNKGTLSLTLKIANKNPISIEFIQTSRAAEDSFGFRITWNLTLNNQFQPLKGIRGRARDPNEELKDDINEFVADAHPGFAHFHQDAAFIPNPFMARDCDCESEHDFKVEGNAVLGASSTAEVKGIGVHQIEEQGFRRSFTVNVEPRLAN